jgi:hypothetical protein
MALSLTPYYAQYPALSQQSLVTLFPYLENLRDHLIRIDPVSPFSGAAKGSTPTAPRTKDGAKRKKKQQGKKWSPKGVINSATGSNPAPDPRDAQLSANAAQIEVALMTAAPAYDHHFDMSDPQGHTFLSSSARTRVHYCWLHGWNNSHEGNVCSIMTRDNQYTAVMRNAASPNTAIGGNPKIGVPVTYTRPQFVFSRKSSVCLSSSHPFCRPCARTTPPSLASRDKPATTPNEEIRVSDAKK